MGSWRGGMRGSCMLRKGGRNIICIMMSRVGIEVVYCGVFQQVCLREVGLFKYEGRVRIMFKALFGSRVHS
jgi:hypothetical protein